MAKQTTVGRLENPMSDEPQKSYVMVQFAEIGSVIFKVNIEGVTPLQLIAIAEYLSLKGKNDLVRQENERVEHEQQMKLLVPDKSIQVGRV